MSPFRILAGVGLLTAGSLAQAQETVDLGFLKDSELKVVQSRLYSKTDRSELSLSAGVIPFDPFTIAPKVQASYGKWLSESFSWEVQLGGGYGLTTGDYRELTSPSFGAAPEAYRYLGSVTGGVQWSPVYAKMAWGSGTILHHDVYFPLVTGVTMEQIVNSDLLTDGQSAMAVSPTVGTGIGVHLYRAQGPHLRIELRDDVLLQSRASGSTRIKQNWGLTVGLTWLGESS